MDNIILGLLILKSRTIYELRERVDKGLNLMYSNSTGSIQAALKKLLAGGYISFNETEENGRRKKVYSITESGRRCFFNWVNSPMGEGGMKSPELVKIYFMGFSDKSAREKNIESHIEVLKAQRKILNEICRQGENADVPPEGKDIFKFQLVTARYGRDFLEFNIKWYEGLLSEIRSEKI